MSKIKKVAASTVLTWYMVSENGMKMSK